MSRTLATAAVVLALAGSTSAQEVKLTVKVEDAAPPKELSEAVRGVLSSRPLNVLDEKGKVFCTIWPVKALESKATADQVKAGLKYSHLEETTLVGAVKFPETWIDYRKQKIKPGVYTLRLAAQLMDGDHMGTAPHNEFCLLGLASEDTVPDTMDVKDLYELSSKASPRKHPAVMLLYPHKMPIATPAIEHKPKDHTLLSFQIPVMAAGEKTHLGFGVVVVGVTTAE